ncbi:glycosyltransferase family 4 protein [Fictibacillus sp. Mic-4]|uniref:glycosyltransferase family 4 protein n=1 Tax=Fictibacillus TaxID=1329200 RepID=UPI0003FB3AE1|nr:glycosyltransferase family 4 protein [Fictibacillus gelatini]
MNILFTYYVPSGGVETLNRQRCKALSRSGINCHLLYAERGSGIQNIEQIPTFITNNDTEIKQIIETGKYDAIIVCSNYFLLPKLREMGYKGKVVFEVQGLGERDYADTLMKSIYDWVSTYADGLLYPETPHIKEIMEKYYPNMKKYCFHNCFDASAFSYCALPKESPPIVGWVGRIERNKNWKLYLTIGHLLIEHKQAIKLWMFHDPSYVGQNERDEFEKTVDRLGLRSILTIFENIPHSKMQEYYSTIGDSGGFLCSTSITEGFGYALVEALVCRCPVLTTDSDGVKSFIVHNHTGKYISLDQKTILKEALELMENDTLRETIRNNGQQFVQDVFSPNIYCSNFIRMLDELLS